MTDHNDTKKCTKCKRDLPLTEFHRANNRPSGVRSQCKQCVCASRREYTANNLASIVERNRQYRAENHERVVENRRRYDAENRENRRQYRIDNRERLTEYKKQYRAANREKIAERDRAYWKSERGKEISRAAVHKRRAHRLSNGGVFSSADIETIRKRQTNPKTGKLICWWCDKPIDGSFEIDHRIPLSRGGTNDAGNLCLTHRSCNRQKNNKLPSEYNGRLI